MRLNLNNSIMQESSSKIRLARGLRPQMLCVSLQNIEMPSHLVVATVSEHEEHVRDETNPESFTEVVA